MFPLIWLITSMMLDLTQEIKTRGYSNNNQGTVVDGSEKGANVYSYLDAAISGSPWYNSSGQDSKECQYTYPLYFGNMFDTKNR